jgi:lipopolysaccharide export system permease protein
MRLVRYMSTTLVKRALTAALILAFIAEVLDLVDSAGDIIDRGDGAQGMLRYVALRLPTLLTHALPLGALVGALLTLALFARNSEITAMRSAGRSTWNLFVAMLPGALVLVVVHSTLMDVITPRTESSLAVWLAEGAELRQKDAKPVWIRVGDAVVSFDQVSDRGRRLRNVRIYERDERKLVVARTMAAEARYRQRRWTLSGAERVSWARGEGFNQKTAADGPWETTLTPEDALSALAPESRVSLSTARAVIAGERTPNAPLSFYETLVERIYAAPLGAIVMTLLAMPAALVNWRDARSARHGVLAAVAGLSFLLADGLLSTLALTGVISPVAGAWSALVAFTVFGILRIRQIDGGWSAPASARPQGRLSPEPSH